MIFRLTSKKPIVIVGNGVRESGAVELLHEFYDKTKIPVVTTMNAVDIMQDENKLGFIGVYGNRVANMLVDESDLIISIGARLGLRQIGNRREFFAPKAFLIRADIDQYELSRDIKDNEEKHLVDAGQFLQVLLRENIPRYDVWNKKCFLVKELLSAYDKEVGNICLEHISKILPQNAIVAVDIGQAQCWAAQSLTLIGRNGRILIGGSYGSMGCGLPYAIGASIGQDNNKVYCITGDGGLQMNIQELQVVASEKLPIKIFVINNRSLGKITEIQARDCKGRYSITTKGSGYNVPDFVKISEAYGIKAKQVDDFSKIKEYSEWISDNEPCLFNIILPDNTLLLPKMNWNEREMKPLLSSKLLKEAHNILCQ